MAVQSSLPRPCSSHHHCSHLKYVRCVVLVPLLRAASFVSFVYLLCINILPSVMLIYSLPLVCPDPSATWKCRSSPTLRYSTCTLPTYWCEVGFLTYAHKYLMVSRSDGIVRRSPGLTNYRKNLRCTYIYSPAPHIIRQLRQYIAVVIHTEILGAQTLQHQQTRNKES